jgi:hypothetical protein
MFGVESMPYCCAAKSMANERGAIHLAVECVIHIVRRLGAGSVEFGKSGCGGFEILNICCLTRLRELGSGDVNMSCGSKMH